MNKNKRGNFDSLFHHNWKTPFWTNEKMTLQKTIKNAVRGLVWRVKYGFFDHLLPKFMRIAIDEENTEHYSHDRSGYPLVSIIIVTWNHLEYTKLCIENIFEQNTYQNIEIIVVDNGSQDGTLEYLRKIQLRKNNVTVINNQVNLGFAKANNIGIGHAKGQYIILLNNDTVVTSGWVEGIIRYLTDREIGMVGPVTNNVGNEARIRVYYHDLIEMAYFAKRYAVKKKGHVFDIPMLAMYCTAIRRETINKIGLLDEQFEVGKFEDNDYARRVRNAGFRIVCAADVFIHHFGSASIRMLSESEYRMIFEQNRQRYEKKWDIR